MSEQSPRRPLWRRIYQARGIGYPLRLAAGILMLPRRFWSLQQGELDLQRRLHALEAREAGRSDLNQEGRGDSMNPERTDQSSPIAGPAVAGGALIETVRQADPALARALVEEVFQGVLKRSPGPQGAEAYPRRLREGMALRELIAELTARPDAPRPPRRTEHFDSERYLRDHRDVAEGGLDPLEHYVTFGRREGRAAYDRSGVRLDPPGSSSDYFDGERYLDENPDVAAGGLEPLDHYLRFGVAEGRAAYGRDGTSIDAPGVVSIRTVRAPVAPPPPPKEVVTTPEMVRAVYLGRLEGRGRGRHRSFAETMNKSGLASAVLALEDGQ